MSQLNTQLSQLEADGLVSLSASEPEIQYSFLHSLMHEAAYASLTRSDRRLLHQLVGAALETLYPDRREELAPRLSEHFFRAGDFPRAYQYYFLAGKSAQQIYANAVAAMHYAHALKLVRGKFLTEAPAEDELVDLYLRLGRVLELEGRFEHALQHYQMMEADALSTSNRPLELAALIAMGTILSTPTDLIDTSKAEEISTRALALSREIADRAAESKVLWNLMLSNYFSKQDTAALEFGNQSLAIARELGLREQMAFTMNDIASFVLFSRGEFEKSDQLLEEARTIWQDLKNLPMLANNLTNLSFNSYALGKFDLGLRHAEEANRLSTSIGNPWGQAYSRGVMATIYSQRGMVNKSFELIEDAIALSRVSGFTGVRCIGLCVKSGLLSLVGDAKAGLLAAREAVEMAKNGLWLWHTDAYSALILCQVQLGDLDGAEKTLQIADIGEITAQTLRFSVLYIRMMGELLRACQNYPALLKTASDYLNELDRHNIRAFRPEALIYQSLALKNVGRPDEARSILQQAILLADDMQIYTSQWEGRASLAALEQSAGNAEAAEKWWREARQHLDTFLKYIDTPEHRQSFTALPEVKAVLEATRA